MNQGHGSVSSGLGSDRMASTRVVRAQASLLWRLGSDDAVTGMQGRRRWVTQGKKSAAVGAPGHGCGRGKMARRQWGLGAHREGERK